MIVTALNLKTIGRLLRAACVVWGLGGCTQSKPVANRALLNVDGTEMTASVFADQLALKLRHLDALTAKNPNVIQRAKDDLSRDFIISVLSDNWAKGNNIFVRAEDLEKEVKKIRSNYPDDNAFEKVLAEQGITFKEWREALRRSLLQKLIADRLNQKVTPPSDEELRSYYQNNKDSFERPEQVQIRQIVLAKEADIKMIEELLKKGKAMSELAENHSITPEGKRSKGVIGWIEKGVMEGFDSAFTMRIGQRSTIIKSPYGYHIFEVMGKRPAQTLPFEQVKARIQRHLLANRGQAVFTAWLEGELRKARVLKDQELISKIRIETKGD